MRIEDDVVARIFCGVVSLPVVDYLMSAELSDELEVLRATHSGYLRTEMARHLNGEATDAA